MCSHIDCSFLPQGFVSRKPCLQDGQSPSLYDETEYLSWKKWTCYRVHKAPLHSFKNNEQYLGKGDQKVDFLVK